MKKSDTIGQLALALAKAQGEMTNPEKTLTNPHFKSKYADITAGIDAVREPLSKVGIAFIQTTRIENDTLVLETVLIHGESGEWISSETPVIALPAKPQEVGAAQTYYRRYNLFALVGIAGDTPDDDGNEANKQATPAPRKLQPPRPPQMTEEGSALYLSGLLEQVTGAKTREDLKSILVRSTTERSAMWDDDREAFKAAFRTAEERIFSEREGKAE